MGADINPVGGGGNIILKLEKPTPDRQGSEGKESIPRALKYTLTYVTYQDYIYYSVALLMKCDYLTLLFNV